MKPVKKKKDRTVVAIAILLMFTALFVAVAANAFVTLREKEIGLLDRQIELEKIRNQHNSQHPSDPGGTGVVDGDGGSEEPVVIPITTSPMPTQTPLLGDDETSVVVSPNIYVCISKNTVRCYQYPDTSSAVVGRLNTGDEVVVMSDVSGYYLVNLDGKVGYVEKKCLSKRASVVAVPDAVDLRSFIEEANFNLVFASENNITGAALYPAVPILESETAEMLLKASNLFLNDGYRLVVYDAYRPKSAQYAIYDELQDNIYIENPYTTSSLHQFGRAVDITLIDMRSGEELEMPTKVYEFKEAALRDNRFEWSTQAATNADYMRYIMTSVGFTANNKTWWHFENLRDGGAYLDENIDLSGVILD